MSTQNENILETLNKSELTAMIKAHREIEVSKGIPEREAIACVAEFTPPKAEYCDPLKEIRGKIMAFMEERMAMMATSCDKDCLNCPPIKVAECWVSNARQFE